MEFMRVLGDQTDISKWVHETLDGTWVIAVWNNYNNNWEAFNTEGEACTARSLCGLVFSVDRLLRGLRAQDILTRPDFEKLASDLIQMTRPDGVAVARAWMGDLPAEEML